MTDSEFKDWLRKPASIRVMLIEVVANIAGVETTLYLSNMPYISDTNIGYTACVSGGISFTENLSLDGTASSGSGDVEVENSNGIRDSWLDYVWANRIIKVYMGDARWVKSDFRLIFDGVVRDLGSTSRSSLVLTLLNKLDRLNNPANETKIGGTTENANSLIPFVLGEAHNVEPLLVNNNQTYRIHDGAFERLIEVRDNGAPRTDVTTDLTTGLFTISGSAVIGQITASVQGAKPAGTYSNNIAALVQHVVTSYGPAATRFTASDLDAANLSAFSSANLQAVGISITGTDTVLSIAQQLASSIGAQVVCTTTGLLRLIRLSLPAVGVPLLVGPEDMDYQTLHIASRTEVSPTTDLAYCKNWTVQTSGLATGLPTSSAELFGKEWLNVTATDTAVTATYRLSTTPEQQETKLLVKTEAQTEANRRTALWKVQHTVYEATYRAHMLLTELGDAITIQHSRYGLNAGKTGIVVSISRDWLGGRTTLGVLI